jgi:glycosyltransferase involved in cell wall biosynthesis
MKVLHVIPSIGPARGGPSVVIRTMARSQAEQGLEVDVVSTDDNGTGRLDASSSIPFTEHAVKYWVFPRQTRFYTVSFPLAAWMWKHAADYDMIHIHALFSFASIVAAWCAKWAGVPYIVRPLGTLNLWGMHHRRPWLKKLSFRVIESRILRNAAGVQYTSQQEANEAGQLGVPHTALLVPNPVDLPEPCASRGLFRALFPILAGKTIVLFLSRLDTKKGIDLLLPAFARIRIKHPEVVLVLAGNGDPALLEDLRQQARQLGLGDKLLWAGFLEGEKKRNAFADADIFVLPSYSENFGVAVVEAMGAGLPAVISDQIGIHDQIAAAGAGIVVECVIEQIESALVKLIEDVDLRARMGENALRFAQQFAPEEVALQLATMYAKILSRNVEQLAV